MPEPSNAPRQGTIATRAYGSRTCSKPLACVIGGMDLVRALALGGIRSAVVAKEGEVSRYSRFAVEVLDAQDSWSHQEQLVERLLRFGEAQAEQPVLCTTTETGAFSSSRATGHSYRRPSALWCRTPRSSRS